MYELTNDIAVNRSLFTPEADSRLLRAGTAVVHGFADAGAYEVVVDVGHRPVDRFVVEVAADAGMSQVTVDLSTDALPSRPDRGARHLLRIGGVLVFHRGFGGMPTSVRIARLGDDRSTTVVDTADRLVAGEAYAITVGRPGSYQLQDRIGDHGLALDVDPLDRDVERMRRPATVRLTDAGFDPERRRIVAGQTLVVLLAVDARIVTRPAGQPT